jgi:hypothetical protein
VLKNYAIGGAVGASFYIDAVQTEYVDAFVVLANSNSPLISLKPIYAALNNEGGVVEGAHVRFGNWPLQVLTDANSLIAEAIEQAVTVSFEGVPTRVFRAEHLAAIALQTGRSKDYSRVAALMDSGTVDTTRLDDLISRYGLKQQRSRALDYIKSLTWEQKVASIERMNKADKIAKQAMREAMQAERDRVDSVS